MSFIQIKVLGKNIEIETLTLDVAQVTSLYNNYNVALEAEKELQKEKKNLEQSLTYARDQRLEYENELKQAHSLLTALNIQEKTQEEETYCRRPLTMSTRIALYIAGTK